VKCPDCNGEWETSPSFCSHCGRTGGDTTPARTLSVSAPSQSRLSPERAAYRERLPERKPFPLEWVFPAILLGSLGALIGCILPGQPWQPGALIGFLLVALPKKKLS